MAAPKDAKVLDFFGGSGTTAEAVLYLNSRDGGTREVTIVTDDFNSIGTRITRERIVRVMSGRGWDNPAAAHAYGGRLAVYRVGAQPAVDIDDEDSYQSWSRSAALWSVLNTFPLIDRDTGNILVTRSSDGMDVCVLGYGIDVEKSEVEMFDAEFPEALWYGIFTSYEPYKERLPYIDLDVQYATGELNGEVTYRTERRPVQPLPYPAMDTINGVMEAVTEERAEPSHTEQLRRALNSLNPANK